MINSISSHTLLPGGWGGAESSELLIWFGLPGDQLPSRNPPRVTSLE